MVHPKQGPRAPREALRPRRVYPRVVDLGYGPPRDAPPVDRADPLRLVVHRHHRLPVHPQLGRHAPRRGGLDPARSGTLLRTPEICEVWLGLARTHRDRDGLRVWLQN